MKMYQVNVNEAYDRNQLQPPKYVKTKEEVIEYIRKLMQMKYTNKELIVENQGIIIEVYRQKE